MTLDTLSQPLLKMSGSESKNRLAKFIMSIGDESFRFLGVEAKNRDVTVQQLLRAIIVPEWIKKNMNIQTSVPPDPVRPAIYGVSPRGDNRVLLSPVNRLRTSP